MKCPVRISGQTAITGSAERHPEGGWDVTQTVPFPEADYCDGLVIEILEGDTVIEASLKGNSPVYVAFETDPDMEIITLHVPAAR